MVDADPVLLERAIANLVDNALRFAPPGEPVRVEAGAVAGRVDLRVVDTRSGHPAGRARARCSGPSSASATAPTAPAWASGLAVARGFVVAMGGDLTAEDTPGGGTTMVSACAQAQR